jgi:hypothetical protein
MQDHATDPGVFIRSMATRGHLGGLSLATPEAVRLLDAIGRKWILVETVGVGQVEVEVAGKADTTVVVVNPGWGDSVQANKAGLMEIADVFVINKADRKGVEETSRDLMQMLDLSDLPHESWRPPIIPTVGSTGQGIVELWDAVLAHREYAERRAISERREFRLGEELREIVAQRLGRRARQICSGDRWDELTAEVVGRSPIRGRPPTRCSPPSTPERFAVHHEIIATASATKSSGLAYDVWRRRWRSLVFTPLHRRAGPSPGVRTPSISARCDERDTAYAVLRSSRGGGVGGVGRWAGVTCR